ncbi:MAG: hypothetical protein U9Q67_03525 [Patescibacteria group bacterium]|nr:hypothetical protein [Patescibacteria group bacterium]
MQEPNRKLLPFGSISVSWSDCTHSTETCPQSVDDFSRAFRLAHDKGDFECFVLFGGHSDWSLGKVVWQGFFRFEIR